MNAGFLRLTAGAKRLKVDYFSVSFDDPPIKSRHPWDSVAIESQTAARTAR
jgi:hypothetical protein